MVGRLKLSKYEFVIIAEKFLFNKNFLVEHIFHEIRRSGTGNNKIFGWYTAIFLSHYLPKSTIRHCIVVYNYTTIVLLYLPLNPRP